MEYVIAGVVVAGFIYLVGRGRWWNVKVEVPVEEDKGPFAEKKKEAKRDRFRS